MRLDDLTPVARVSVGGDQLPTGDLDAVHRTVDRLRGEQLPLCTTGATSVPQVPGRDCRSAQ